MSLLRYFVTVGVAVPMTFIVSWPPSLFGWFLIAVVSISIGYGVDALVNSRRPQAVSMASRTTNADQRWNLEMLLRKAAAAEKRGEIQQAIKFFEQAILLADERDDADFVRREIKTVVESTRSLELKNHQWPTAPADKRSYGTNEEEAARLLAATDEIDAKPGPKPTLGELDIQDR